MESPLQKVCICCHEERENLKSLLNCNFTYILNCLVNNGLAFENYNICDVCHITLKKINKFKNYVEENNKLLNEKLANNHIKFTNLHKCQTSNIELIWTTIDGKLEHAIKEAFDDLNIEVKVENDNDSDLKMEPFEVPTIDNENWKALPVRKKKPLTQFQANYEGKINILTISMEDLINERMEAAKDKKYLQLPYKCTDCIVAFDYEDAFKEHRDKKHNVTEGSIVCTICKSAFSSQMSYNCHWKRHTRRYECAECGKRNKNIYPILGHYNEVHGNIPVEYSCKLCDYRTNSNRSYRYHMDKHRTGNVQCNECGNVFVNATGLKHHMRTVHKTIARLHKCDVCGKSYKRRCALYTHKQTHTQTGAYCASCDLTFKTQSTLIQHLKMTSKHFSDDLKRFTCDECGKKFLTKSSLVNHIEFDHLKSRKYSCDKCSKVFKYKNGLKRHMLSVHENVRPPRNKICDQCGRGFTSTSILKTHIRTHTGERPLHCPLCPATFAHSGALYTHNKLLHQPKRKT